MSNVPAPTNCISGTLQVPFASTLEFVWLSFLVLSFSYERPAIVLFPFDRLNPRLFDFVFLSGLFIVLPFLRKRRSDLRLPPPLKTWWYLLIVFSACAVIGYFTFVPSEIALFSFYYLFKYFEGLFVLYLVCKISINAIQKQRLFFMAVLGGVFVSAYTIWQHISGVSTVSVNPNIDINLSEGSLLGPLGYGYYHLGLFSSTSFVIAISFVRTQISPYKKLIFSLVSIFIAVPIFLSGSRTGILALAVMLFFYMYFLSRGHKIRLLGFMSVVVLGFLVFGGLNELQEVSSSVKRVAAFEDEENENSIYSRIMKFTEFSLKDYVYDGDFVPLMGAGFYVAPVFEGGIPYYRIGYGFHNAYVFAFEQGGVLAFTLFIIFLVQVWKYVNKVKNKGVGLDRIYAVAVLSVFAGMLTVAMVGHGFWYGSTLHLSFYTFFLYLLAGRHTQFANVITPLALKKQHIE